MSIVDEHKTGSNSTTGDGHKTVSSRVEFSTEQQTRVQHLIDEAYRKAYSKAAKNMVPQGELDRMHSEIDVLREDRKRAALLGSVSRHNVVDATEVAELIRPYLQEDESGNFVVNACDGAEGSNGGVLMGVDDFVAGWLSERPHHVRGAGMSGGGSRAALYGEARTRYNLSDPAAWRNMPREELDRLLKDGVDVRGVSGQLFKFKDVRNPFHAARKRKIKIGG